MRFFKEPEPNDPKPKYPCGNCNLNIAKNMKALRCHSCNYKTHIRCDGITASQYVAISKLIQVKNEPYLCKMCRDEVFPFHDLSDEEYLAFERGLNVNCDTDTLKVLPNQRLKSLLRNLNSLSLSDADDDDIPGVNCKYYHLDDISRNNFKQNGKISLLHMNIASLNAHKDEFEEMLSMLKIKLDIIGLTETKIIKGMNPIFDKSIEGFTDYSTPTESEKGGTILYINTNLDSIPRTDLDKQLNVSRKLESSFCEILVKGKKNIIVGCVYKHPSMDITEFNDLFEDAMEKITSENKEIYLLGDFNLDLLKLEDNDAGKQVDEYLNILCKNFLVPHITLPTRITSTSATLIDNIFSNNLEFTRAISGNLTVTISDHLPQILFVPGENVKVPRKANMYTRSKDFDRENLVADFLNLEWDSILELNKADPNHSIDNLFTETNKIIDTYLPLKKVLNKDLKAQSKPWITKGIRKSMKRRDKLLKLFIKSHDPAKKELLHTQYKALRNKIVSLMRVSKKTHFRNYFSENAKNIKKTWTGIKSVISIRNASHGQPTSMNVDGEITNDPTKIANGLNNFYSTVAEKLQGSIKSNGIDFMKYMKNPSKNAFCFESADYQEILLIIVSLSEDKASGPNSLIAFQLTC